MGERTAPHDGGAAQRPLFGPQTALAIDNFAVGGPRLADLPELVRALAQVKLAAARANARVGALPADVAAAIAGACEEVLGGAHRDAFAVPALQGGGGTSTHMNVNEVLAALASRRLGGGTVHPNDHVNRGQSTNDVMPTAIALAVAETADRAAAGIARPVAALEAKATEYAGLEHLGRTCLQDAVAIPVATTHRVHAHGIARAAAQLEHAAGELLAVPLGATAVGTGIGAADGFAAAALAELTRISGRSLSAAPEPAWSLSSLETLVAVAEAADRCGRALARVGADLRLLSSGPAGGIGEVTLPRVQAGSSIMPGKVNPVICELMMQVSFHVSGQATAARAASAAGELEVSAMAPVVTLGLLDGLARLGRAATILAERCLSGLTWNEPAVRDNLDGSLSAAVLQSAREGYDRAARARGSREAA